MGDKESVKICVACKFQEAEEPWDKCAACLDYESDESEAKLDKKPRRAASPELLPTQLPKEK